MGRAPCCDKANVKKGPWSPEEDAKLKEFIEKFGTAGNWISLPQKAGLKRCGKSCRLRWLNYLRPNIKHGEFSDEEDRIICSLYASIGSRWSIIAAQLPGRTDNDIKNYWNTKLKKKLFGMANIPSNRQGIKFSSSQPFSLIQSQNLSNLSHLYNSFYTQAAKSLTSNNIDQSNIMANYYQPLFTNQCSYYQPNNYPEGLLDFQYNNCPVKDNNMLMFGGNEASSSSNSDGSCSQISYGTNKDHHVMMNSKQEEIGVFQGNNFISSNGTQEADNQKFMLNYGKNPNSTSSILDDLQKPNGIIESSQLEYDLEDVKQLITANDSNNFMFNDENKVTGERGMMYYY